MTASANWLPAEASVVTDLALRVISTGEKPRREWRFRPVVVLRAAIVLLVVAQLGRIPMLSTGSTEAPLLLNDIVVMAVLGIVFVSALHARSFRLDLVAGVAVLFCAVGAISAALAIPRFGLTGTQLVVSLAYLARWVVYFSIYLAIINVVRSDDVLAVWRTVEATILAFAAFGIIQAIFLPHFAQLVYPDSVVWRDWDEQGHRLVSTALDPNIAGAMLVIVLLIELAQLASGERVALWRPVMLFAALIATLSRSAILSFMVGACCILLVLGISRRMLKLGLLIGTLGLAALPKILSFAAQFNKLRLDDSSALGRIVNWLRGLRVWADHPIIGIGFNTYGYVSERYGSVRLGTTTYSLDGGLLFIAVMTGTVGLALYCLMLYFVVRNCRRVWRDLAVPSAWRALATGTAAATAAILVNSLFVNSLLTTFVMEMLWILWGGVFVLASAARRTSAPPAAVRLIACRPAA
jgi:putative inorganic carbon (HCO3(-)) transporter